MNSKKIRFIRILNIDLPAGQSAFLWGPRKTGKSTFLKERFPNSLYFDLLHSDLFVRWSGNPALFREELLATDKKKLANPVIIDEVQLIPALLNEIHWLIENADIYFVLCGSSARKLRKTGANLLGGRAWRFSFFPLVYPEVPDIALLNVFQRGLIPSHYLATHPKRALTAYVKDYLYHEIQMEGLARNLADFSRFLSVFAFSNGELTNFSNIARDCDIDSKTVKSYYQILVDTMFGYFVFPYSATEGRDTLSSVPKFYLFDVGIAHFLSKTTVSTLKGSEAGKAFEGYIFTELIAYTTLYEKEFEIRFWRTRSGLEVDFVLGDAICAIEVKITDQVQKPDIKGLVAFLGEHPKTTAIVVSQDPRKRLLTTPSGTITVYPWREFLEALWGGVLI